MLTLGAQVESGVVSHECLKAKLTNAKMTTSVRAFVTSYSGHIPLLVIHAHPQTTAWFVGGLT